MGVYSNMVTLLIVNLEPLVIAGALLVWVLIFYTIYNYGKWIAEFLSRK